MEDARFRMALGERLRQIRTQQGLSLHDVQRRSGGRLKASVVGAYERGERAVSVARLQMLAEFYGVPVRELIPTEERPRGRSSGRSLRLYLDRIGGDVPGADMLRRFAESIRAQRGDYGQVLTIRASDVTSLATVLDLSETELTDRLVSAGVAVPAD